jgi:hypothetical protein
MVDSSSNSVLNTDNNTHLRTIHRRDNNSLHSSSKGTLQITLDGISETVGMRGELMYMKREEFD